MENELAEIGQKIWDKMDAYYGNVEIESENDNS
jgi:hypothetical protein